jgi:hypothetical protein
MNGFIFLNLMHFEITRKFCMHENLIFVVVVCNGNDTMRLELVTLVEPIQD